MRGCSRCEAFRIRHCLPENHIFCQTSNDAFSTTVNSHESSQSSLTRQGISRNNSTLTSDIDLLTLSAAFITIDLLQDMLICYDLLICCYDLIQEASTGNPSRRNDSWSSNSDDDLSDVLSQESPLPWEEVQGISGEACCSRQSLSAISDGVMIDALSQDSTSWTDVQGSDPNDVLSNMQSLSVISDGISTVVDQEESSSSWVDLQSISSVILLSSGESSPSKSNGLPSNY